MKWGGPVAEYVRCSDCSARVELTPQRKHLKAHYRGSQRCPGSGKPPTATPPRSRRKSRLVLGASAFTSLVAVAAGITAILEFVGVSPSPPKSPTVIVSEPSSVKIASSSQQLVSADKNSKPGDGSSGRPSFDDSGRYVAFTSEATNLSLIATNGEYNIYRKDRETGLVYLASPGVNGTAANGTSQFPIICANGRYIAFASEATNLVSGGGQVAGTYFQVYVNDALTHQTTLVSASSAGVPANGDSRAPRFDHGCSKIVFESAATNLVPGKTNHSYNIFVRDLHTNSTTMASVGNSGTTLNNGSTHADINRDGTLVAFTSWATDLPGAVPGRPEVYLRDLQKHRTIDISSLYQNFCPDAQGFSWPNFSPDGRYLIFTSVDSASNIDFRGKCVLVWDITKQASAITTATGNPAGWNDACVTGVNNGTNFSPVMSDPTRAHPYLVLFTVTRNGVCNLVLRDLDGNDIPIKSQINLHQILEPTISSSGDYLSWDVASQRQQIYACRVDQCAEGIS
jgi:Tol biopolymer transport system component